MVTVWGGPSLQMPARWTVKGGADEEQVVDEFTCPQALRERLLLLQPLVERVFSVHLGIGAEEETAFTPFPGNQQIWLNVRGGKREAGAAKVLIKGLVNQEVQKAVAYTMALHCVFCGARGLFMDCLMRNTSAHMMVTSPGSLVISGLTESVVQAYSLVLDLMDRYKNSPEQCVGARSGLTSESLDSCRAFKSLVERWEDRHTMDLLVLPAAVKETLLTLVRESGLDQAQREGQRRPGVPLWSEVGAPSLRDREVGLRPGRIQTQPNCSSTAVLSRPRDVQGGGAEGEGGMQASEPVPFFLPDTAHPGFEGKEEQHGRTQQEVEGELELSVGSGEEFGLQLMFLTAMGYSETVVRRVLARTGPREVSEVLDLVQQEQGRADKENPRSRESDSGSSWEREEEGENGDRGRRKETQGEGGDFVLAVLKRAAASCGYREEKVMEVYSNLPGLSPAQLLAELQRESKQEEAQGQRGEHGEVERGEKPEFTPALVPLEPADTETASPAVRGPPDPTYPPPRSVRAKDRAWPTPVALTAVVTGEQRFHDGLQMPFNLKLTGDPGDRSLRQVIIDGSNVAMSHGLGQFFSCRGIALAVQYFWSQGHRRVTTFVPQWRLKRDPKVKEAQYLTELQNLGLLSFTPSREVQGKRICSYDDRFMLNLAQETDGVIVTNDNLRDLVDESSAWKNIIKKRLLQYTFVGDIFMVPEDPLGRGGPHLRDFLRSTHRSPVPGSHTFAGQGSSPSRLPNTHANTEVLQYRDRTPGVPPFRVGSAGSESGRGRGRPRTGLGRTQGERERSSNETSSLRKSLSNVFPGQSALVTMTLDCNPSLTDINSLSDIILELQAERERNGREESDTGRERVREGERGGESDAERGRERERERVTQSGRERGRRGRERGRE